MNGFKDCAIVSRPVGEYHTNPAERGSRGFVIGQGQLIEFAKCPQRWVRGYSSPPSESKDWGSMVDCLFLTPDEWCKRYVCCPETYPAPAHHEKVKKGKINEGDPLPWNTNAAICEAWEAEQKATGKEIVKAQTFNRVRAAVDRLSEDSEICELLQESKRQVWVAGVYVDAATGMEVPVKSLIDLAPDRDSIAWGDWLGDFKTTKAADPRIWARWVWDRKYHVQAAFYLDLFNSATGESRNKWFHLVQENFAPYETGKRILSPGFIEGGRLLYRQWLADYCRCLATGVWPGYDRETGWTTTEPENWMLEQDLLSMFHGAGDPGDDSDLDAIAPAEEVAA